MEMTRLANSGFGNKLIERRYRLISAQLNGLQLERLLEVSGIYVNSWFDSQGKTAIDILTDEIQNQQFKIKQYEDGELVLTAEFLGIDVTYVAINGLTYELKSTVPGGDNSPTLIEKIGYSDNVFELVSDAMSKKLGLKSKIAPEFHGTELIGTMELGWLLGLKTEVAMKKIEVQLTDDQFNLLGYSRQNGDDREYYVWSRCKQAIS